MTTGGGRPQEVELLQIADAAELRHAARSISAKKPAHVLIKRADIATLSELRQLVLDRKIYSVYVLDVEFDVEVFANEFDTAPVFKVKDADEAAEIAAHLVRDPYEVAGAAINGPAVLERYGEGHPT